MQMDLKNDFKMEDLQKSSKQLSFISKYKVKNGKRNGSNSEINSLGSKLSTLDTLPLHSTLRTTHEDSAHNTIAISTQFPSLKRSATAINQSTATLTSKSSSTTSSTGNSNRAVTIGAVSVIPFSSTVSAALSAVSDTIAKSPQETPDAYDFTEPSDPLPPQQPLSHDAAILLDVFQEQHYRGSAVVAASENGRQRDSTYRMPWGFYFISWISCGCLSPQAS